VDTHVTEVALKTRLEKAAHFGGERGTGTRCLQGRAAAARGGAIGLALNAAVFGLACGAFRFPAAMFAAARGTFALEMRTRATRDTSGRGRIAHAHHFVRSVVRFALELVAGLAHRELRLHAIREQHALDGLVADR
jgi:hypothetical protein